MPVIRLIMSIISIDEAETTEQDPLVVVTT